MHLDEFLKNFHSQRLLSSCEVARTLKITPQTLSLWRSRNIANQPPYRRVGRLVRYDRDELAAWLEAQTVQP